MMSLTWRWFWRSTQRREYLWLWLAVILSSASVTLISQVSQSVRATMVAETVNSMGAQLLLRSTQPIDRHWAEQAAKADIMVGELIQLNTMIAVDDAFQLVSLRAVSPAHPDSRWLTFEAGAQDQVVIDQGLAQKMNLSIGQTLALGKQTFRIVGIHSHQDPLAMMVNQLAPPVFIPIAQIDRLGLTGEGSRISYEHSFLGKPDAVEKLYAALQADKRASWQLIRADQSSQDLENTLSTAWLFLDIAALTTLLIAGLSILIASRFYLQRWVQTLALLRALGVTQARLFWVFGGQLMLLAIMASLIGTAIGVIGFYALVPVLTLWLPSFTSDIPWLPMLMGMVSSSLTFWAFTLPLFWRMIQTKPQQLFRQTAHSVAQQRLAWLISGILLVWVMALLLPAHLRWWVMLALGLTALLLWGFALLLQRVIFKLQPITRGWLRLVIANLKQDPLSLKLQFVAFGLVLYLLLLLTLVHVQLIHHWQASLSDTTPNVFIINVQPEEVQDVQQQLQQHQLSAEMIPILRARLIQHNDHRLSPEDFSAGRAKRLLEREANMAILSDLPAHNTLLQSISSDQRQSQLPAVSVERGMAELFQIRPADRLVFDIQGQAISFQVTAIRDVVWQSLQPNFFFIAEPWTQEALPLTYLSSFYDNLTPSTSQALKASLQQASPSLLWLDVRALIDQIQQLMQQASTAIRFLYGFALLASILVVMSATLAAREARYRQWLVLRTLGAQQRQLILIGLAEYALIGLLAGTLAALLAQLSLALISVYWLSLPIHWDMALWLWSLGLGSGSLVLIAVLSQAKLWSMRPRALMHHNE